ncbi:hypothetical protein GCM10007877_30390 [Marinibactrum halimedae]|uniref:Uncharacterized protein n=1 Tax=Marinibactrum halimedae TaxID=1444977 RepID=A0AA37WNE1_9GAMM|nr:hypothetical protein GCM10007877_30390 [Marinibactrum halimedae]
MNRKGEKNGCANLHRNNVVTNFFAQDKQQRQAKTNKNNTLFNKREYRRQQSRDKNCSFLKQNR